MTGASEEDCFMKTVKDYIRTIPDFPHEGIMFRDVTTLFADPRGLRLAIDQLLHPYAGVAVDKIIGLEARGFILGGETAMDAERARSVFERPGAAGAKHRGAVTEVLSRHAGQPADVLEALIKIWNLISTQRVSRLH